MVTLPADQVAYILAAISIVTGLVSALSPFVAKIPAMSDANLYNWTLRAISFVLNFGAVIISELTLNKLDWHNWLAYVTVAGGAAVGAHVLYHLNTANLRTKYNNISRVVQVPVATPQDGKNSSITPA